MNQRHDLPALLGRTVAPTDVPSTGAARLLPPCGERLETEIKVLDAVLPIERGGTVDLLGPVGMGQLVLVAEIARHVGAVVVAAGTDLFGGLVEEDVLGRSAVVVDGGDPAGAAAADRLAQALAASGRTVLLVVGAAAWTEHPPTAGVVDGGVGSVTAFRFAPHPRDGAPIPAREDAGTRLVWATDAFVAGHHPAIDVPSSASALIDRKLLDPVTVGAAQAARVALERAGRVAAFLTQPMILGEAFTGVPGEQVPARSATEQLAALVR